MTLVHSWLFGAEMTRGELCWLFVVVAMAMTAPREACPPGMQALGSLLFSHVAFSFIFTSPISRNSFILETMRGTLGNHCRYLHKFF